MRGHLRMSLAVALTLGAFLHASSLVLAGQATDPYTGTSHTPMHGQHVGRLDLNSASLEELQHVPGINEATAKKIVENRPYARADDLITKKVLSKTAYDGIKDHIAVTKPAGK